MTVPERDVEISALIEMATRLVDEFELSNIGELDGRSPLLDALDQLGHSTEVIDQSGHDHVFDLVIARPPSEIGSRSAKDLAKRAVETGRVVLWLPDDGEPHRWPEWWDSLFDSHGLVPFDIVRAWLWGDSQVPLVIRQSACLYLRREELAEHGRATMPRDVVHPEMLGQLISEGRRREAYWEHSLEGVQDRVAAVDAGTTSELHTLRERVTSLEHDVDSLNSDAAVIATELDEARLRLIAGRPSTTGSNSRIEAGAGRPIQCPDQRSVRPLLRRAVGALSSVGFRMAPPATTSPLAQRVLRSLSSDALCDWVWYHRTYMSDDPLADPIEHYLQHGSRQRLKPHPLLHPVWYSDQHEEDVGSADALLHYQLLGRRQMLSPHPLFEPSWYSSQLPGNRAARANSAVHYLVYGWRRGRDPHPLFSTDWYLRHYTDVAAANINPLLHYLLYGWREGRHPSPLFHPQWYMEQADLEDGQVDPLEHYIWFGARSGLAPSPLLDPDWYRRHYGLSGGDPLMPVRHYIAYGLPAGLEASPWDAALRRRLVRQPTTPPSDAPRKHAETAHSNPRDD